MKNQVLFGIAAALIVTTVSNTPVQAREIAGASEINNPVELTYRTLGAASGITFGTPIATVRTIPLETMQGVMLCAKEFSSTGDPDGLQYAVATIPGIALGLTNGIFKGVTRGITHGANQGFENPFSLDSFSLKEMED